MGSSRAGYSRPLLAGRQSGAYLALCCASHVSLITIRKYVVEKWEKWKNRMVYALWKGRNKDGEEWADVGGLSAPWGHGEGSEE